MSVSADCVNTKSTQGRNATPLPIIKAAKSVLGEIELDPCSDDLINSEVGAKMIYTFEDDGFSKEWKAKTVWLNAPGTTFSQGKQLKASAWYRKLLNHWIVGDIEAAIAIVYRAGSIGSLGNRILRLPICLTTAGVESEIVNGSGRLSFEIIEDGERVSQTSNTQSSMFILYPKDDDMIINFSKVFSQFGVVKA